MKKILGAAACAVAASCAMVLAAPTICSVVGVQSQTDAYAATCKVSKKAITVKAGSSQTISLKGITAKQSKSVKWTSTNAKVAKVKKVKTKGGAYSCTVTGVKAGKCTVKAVYKKKTYKCAITVKQAASTPTEAFMQAIENSSKAHTNKNGDKFVSWGDSKYGTYGIAANRSKGSIDFVSVVKDQGYTLTTTMTYTDSKVANVNFICLHGLLDSFEATTTVDKETSYKMAESQGPWSWSGASGTNAKLADNSLSLSLFGWSTTMLVCTGHKMSEIGFTSL